MKPLRAADVRRAVDAAGRAITAALDMRHKPIVSDMLNSAGSVSAEWYIETLWHYLAKRQLLQGVSSFDVEFRSRRVSPTSRSTSHCRTRKPTTSSWTST